MLFEKKKNCNKKYIWVRLDTSMVLSHKSDKRFKLMLSFLQDKKPCEVTMLNCICPSFILAHDAQGAQVI